MNNMPNTCRILRRRRSGTVQYAAIFFLAIFGALGYGFYRYVVVPEKQGNIPQQSIDEGQTIPVDSSKEPGRYRFWHSSTAVTTSGDSIAIENDLGRAGTRAGASSQPSDPVVLPPKDESKIFIKFSPKPNTSPGNATAVSR